MSLPRAYGMVRDNPDELIKILVTRIPPLSLNCTGNFGLRSALNNRYFRSLNQSRKRNKGQYCRSFIQFGNLIFVHEKAFEEFRIAEQ